MSMSSGSSGQRRELLQGQGVTRQPGSRAAMATASNDPKALSPPLGSHRPARQHLRNRASGGEGRS